MSEIYYLHKIKLTEKIPAADYEGNKLGLAALFVQETGCKKVLFLKNIELPWSKSSKKDDYDYLWVSVWDKEEHRKSTEIDELSKPVIKTVIERFQSLEWDVYVESLGCIEMVGLADEDGAEFC